MTEYYEKHQEERKAYQRKYEKERRAREHKKLEKDSNVPHWRKFK